MTMRFQNGRRLGLLFLAAYCGLAITQTAQGAVIGISATSFVPRDAETTPGDEVQGLLLNAQGRYFAPVVFPESGDQVCSFSLIYRDLDAEGNVVARLKRKPVNLQVSAFTPPILMAQAASTGAEDPIRRSTDTTIADRVTKPAASFYFVELDIASSTIEVLGVQVVFKPNCP